MCPSATVVRTIEISVSDPDCALWTIIDSQLLSSLIATIYASIVPLITGLEHAYQVWEVLEHCFNSISRTHIHDLKWQLYSITKTSTFEAYFDSIKQLAYKSAAVGAPVYEEDLVFYALHGLPPEFDPLRTALMAKVGDITFEELITLVNGEEMHKNRTSSSVNTDASTSVFVAQKSNLSGASSFSQPVQQQSQFPHYVSSKGVQPITSSQ